MHDSKAVLSNWLMLQGKPLPAEFNAAPEQMRPVFFGVEEMMRDQIKWCLDSQRVDIAIHFYLIDSPAFGAFAVSLDGQYFVAMNLGTVATLQDFFSRLMISFEIRDDGEMRKRPQHGLPRISVPLDAWQSHRLSDEKMTDEVATALAWQCIEFIINHEVGHILLGHCDVNDLGLSCARMDDVVKSIQEDNLALRSQAMEMQADAFAVRLSLSSTPPVARVAREFPTRPALRGVSATAQAQISCVLLAIFSMFRLFDEHHWDSLRLQRGSHPPCPMRIFGAIATAKDAFDQLANIGLSAAFEKAVTNLLTSGENVFAHALNRETNNTGLLYMLASENQLHYEKLRQTLQAMLPQLKPLLPLE